MNVEAFAVLAVTKIRVERQTRRRARYVAAARAGRHAHYNIRWRALHLVAPNVAPAGSRYQRSI